jgi:hypothetical protein
MVLMCKWANMSGLVNQPAGRQVWSLQLVLHPLLWRVFLPLSLALSMQRRVAPQKYGSNRHKKPTFCWAQEWGPGGDTSVHCEELAGALAGSGAGVLAPSGAGTLEAFPPCESCTGASGAGAAVPRTASGLAGSGAGAAPAAEDSGRGAAAFAACVAGEHLPQVREQYLQARRLDGCPLMCNPSSGAKQTSGEGAVDEKSKCKRQGVEPSICQAGPLAK